MGRHMHKFRSHASGRGFFSFFLDVVVEAIEERLEQRNQEMSKELLDAVAGVAANVQKIRDAQVSNHVQTLTTLDALKAAIDKAGAGSDPDVAAAIEALGNASASAAQVTDDINSETQAMAAAVAPPAPAADAPAAAPPAPAADAPAADAPSGS